MELRINWRHKRVKHAIERMWLRGVSVREIGAAVTFGRKIFQKRTRLKEAFYKHFSVVYAERIFKKFNTRKIYPITVKVGE